MPSYILKVTKFLVKISQFEFSVMTEKNIFVYKLFLSLNISDFNIFFMWKLQPLPLKKYIGGAWEGLKCCRKIPVKEFIW